MFCIHVIEWSMHVLFIYYVSIWTCSSGNLERAAGPQQGARQYPCLYIRLNQFLCTRCNSPVPLAVVPVNFHLLASCLRPPPRPLEEKPLLLSFASTNGFEKKKSLRRRLKRLTWRRALSLFYSAENKQNKKEGNKIIWKKGQWGWFWRKLQTWGFLYLLTCHPVLYSCTTF